MYVTFDARFDDWRDGVFATDVDFICAILNTGQSYVAANGITAAEATIAALRTRIFDSTQEDGLEEMLASVYHETKYWNIKYRGER